MYIHKNGAKQRAFFELRAGAHQLQVERSCLVRDRFVDIKLKYKQTEDSLMHRGETDVCIKKKMKKKALREKKLSVSEDLHLQTDFKWTVTPNVL